MDFREKRVSANDNINLAVFQALAHLRQFLGGNKPRCACDVHREPAKPLHESLVMLAGEQRGWHHNGDLLAFHDRDEGGAKRNLGFAEAHVAADQPIHRAAHCEVFGDRIDARELIVGFLVREAREKFGVSAIWHREHGRSFGLAGRSHLDEFLGHLADALFEPGFTALPRRAAKLVEICASVVRPITGQQLHIFNGQEQLVAARIFKFHAIMRRARCIYGLQPDEAPNAMIRVHHQIARGEARSLDQHVAGLLGLTAANKPVAQNILLGDNSEVWRFKAALKPKQSEAQGRFVGLARFRDIRDLRDAIEALAPQSYCRGVRAPHWSSTR